MRKSIRRRPDQHVRLLLPITLSALGGVPGAQAQYVAPSVFEQTGVFIARRLAESSGVAVSLTHVGVLWTHNDSGDDPVIYATNLAGEDLGAFRVTGANARDWEDIDLGPCPHQPGWCIYIADTGDNGGRRPHGIIYIVPEPDEIFARDRKRARTKRARKLRVQYPFGAPDIEAMAVGPDGDITLVSKGQRGPIVQYRVPADSVDQKEVLAQLVGAIDLTPQPLLGRLVTGAAISPSGKVIAIRTYTEVDFYRLTPTGRIEGAISRCWIGPREPQGEGIDFLDEATMVLTSERNFGSRGSIVRLRCPFSENPE